MPSAFSPLPEKQFDSYKAAHLLWRAGFGGTWDEAEHLAKLGLKSAVDALVDFPATQKIDPPKFVAAIEERDEIFEQRAKNLDETARRKAFEQRSENERENITDLKFWWLNRMLES